MRKRSELPADDELAFREAVKDATPLPDRGRVAPAPRAALPIATQRLREERQVMADSLGDEPAEDMELEAGEAVAYARPGISRQVVRKLRAGHWAVQDEVDLHGLRSDEARTLLAQFLHQCGKRGLRCVRVIHGKGTRSEHGTPVLKRKVAGWLMQRGEVLAVCQARPADGGSGAVMVLLKGGPRPASTSARDAED